jgi:uroporphyrinogen decarboxylase
VASYLIEGGSSRHYLETKKFMYQDPGAWHALMERLVRVIVAYVNGQVAAGAQAVQLFDSWIGCLSPADYQNFILPHMQMLFRKLTPGAPVIHFGTETAGLLELMAEAGGDVIGVDWRIDLDGAWRRIGFDRAVQGNLDPLVLFAPRDELRRQVERVLRCAGGRPGHIFNLGHGILPQTPVDNVIALVDMVHEMSEKRVASCQLPVAS